MIETMFMTDLLRLARTGQTHPTRPTGNSQHVRRHGAFLADAEGEQGRLVQVEAELDDVADLPAICLAGRAFFVALLAVLAGQVIASPREVKASVLGFTDSAEG